MLKFITLYPLKRHFKGNMQPLRVPQEMLGRSWKMSVTLILLVVIRTRAHVTSWSCVLRQHKCFLYFPQGLQILLDY